MPDKELARDAYLAFTDAAASDLILYAREFAKEMDSAEGDLLIGEERVVLNPTILRLGNEIIHALASYRVAKLLQQAEQEYAEPSDG